MSTHSIYSLYYNLLLPTDVRNNFRSRLCAAIAWLCLGRMQFLCYFYRPHPLSPVHWQTHSRLELDADGIVEWIINLFTVLISLSMLFWHNHLFEWHNQVHFSTFIIIIIDALTRYTRHCRTLHLFWPWLPTTFLSAETNVLPTWHPMVKGFHALKSKITNIGNN